MISYAQNFEDVILRRVFRDRTDGFYIDVGAMDPVAESVTKYFYDLGWSGINIEPNDYFYSKLLEQRPRDINLNFAIDDHEGEKEFFVFKEIGNSTFDEASRDRYVERGFEAKPKRVKVTTLAAICRDYVRRQIDFLKIDCEGWERFVLKGADWDRFRPIVLVIEATEPGTDIPAWYEWEPCLTEHARYDMVYFDGLNRFYLPREYADLRSFFEVPPNIFDEFQIHATIAAEGVGQAVQRERDCLAQRIEVLGQQLNSAMTENERLAESLRAKESEMATALRAKDTAVQAKYENMETQLVQAQQRIAELETECNELNDKLLKARLWVGRLSQDLAASKQRS
jgi:FkbM family methyltransferase